MSGPTTLEPALIARALPGAWRLERWSLEYADGRTARPFTPGAEGLILYTPDGHVSAVLQAPGRGRLPGEDLTRVPDADKAAAFGSYLHYAGRWHVEGESVVHTVEFSMNPNLAGTRQVRTVALDGDRLELTAREPLEGGGVRVHRLVWRRAPAG
ncbi:MAG: lipocalin-like domain-containing protein [Steroidobacteraceae bacterium]